MTKTRDSYLLSARSVPELVRELNFTFQRIADRLDKIEGIRGESQVEESLEVVEIGTIDDDDGEGTRIFGESTHDAAPASTLSHGQWEITVYDDGAAPVFRVRYNDGTDTLIGDVSLI